MQVKTEEKIDEGVWTNVIAIIDRAQNMDRSEKMQRRRVPSLHQRIRGEQQPRKKKEKKAPPGSRFEQVNELVSAGTLINASEGGINANCGERCTCPGKTSE